MSRVFEALTAALREKTDLAKPETGGTAAECDVTARFYRALRPESGLTNAYSALDSPRNEDTSQTSQLKADARCHGFAVHHHKAESELHRVFRLKPAPAALLTAGALAIVFLGMRAYYGTPNRDNSTNTIDSREQNVPVSETSDQAESIPAKSEFGFVAGTDGATVLAKLDSVAPPVQSGNLYKTWAVQVSAITVTESCG